MKVFSFLFMFFSLVFLISYSYLIYQVGEVGTSSNIKQFAMFGILFMILFYITWIAGYFRNYKELNHMRYKAKELRLELKEFQRMTQKGNMDIVD